MNPKQRLDFQRGGPKPTPPQVLQQLLRKYSNDAVVQEIGTFTNLNVPQKISMIGQHLRGDNTITPTQEGQGRRKPNPWMTHVKQVKAKHPNMQLKEVLKLASASYRK